ncbi:hypothetical protein QQF64_036146 [Cirrhinus molitorella]|uniref:Uncharacterized protein n=1 Tax=Cirrhinus molitorella TaxID=172907 RepID=A0ABR3NHS6_9TELE
MLFLYRNPYPGNIINKPNGSDVYAGVPKDYSGEDVTAENFLAALKGDSYAVKKSNPKVIVRRSEKNSKISKFLKGAADRDVGNTDFSMLMACCTSSQSGTITRDYTSSRLGPASLLKTSDGTNTHKHFR